MKRHFTPLLFGAAMLTVLLNGCAADNVDAPNEPLKQAETKYVKVELLSPSGTRATTSDDFTAGTAQENFVGKMTFVFYDASGEPVTNTSYTYAAGENTSDNGFTSSSGNAGVIWSKVVEIQLEKGSQPVAQMMVFINPIETATDIVNLNLEQVEARLVDSYKNGSGNFCMSNSVYYGDNLITGQTGVRLMATPISTGQLYSSEEEAMEDTTYAVDSYVERYCAKVGLSFDSTYSSTSEPIQFNGFTATFVPEYWVVNATDKQVYSTKTYGLAAGTDGVNPTDNPTESELNAELNWQWNDPTNYRSYWACSPGYYQMSYPLVSDNITDVYPLGSTTPENTYPVNYYNLTQIMASSNAVSTSATNYQYANETTTAKEAYAGVDVSGSSSDVAADNPNATMASVLLVGHYKLTPTSTKAAVDISTGDDFYLFGKTNGKWNVYSEQGVLAAMVPLQQIVLVTNDEGTTFTPCDDVSYFEVTHPSQAVREAVSVDLNIPGRFNALQLNLANVPAGTDLYFYDGTKAIRYVKITSENINVVNNLLLSTGYARKFYKGMAFFSVPIRHLGWSANPSGAWTADNGYDWSLCGLGSFGLVRNHVYDIVIESINGLGTGVDGPNQPLVPPNDETSQYIKARVNVLNWRIVPTQTVTL